MVTKNEDCNQADADEKYTADTSNAGSVEPTNIHLNKIRDENIKAFKARNKRQLSLLRRRKAAENWDQKCANATQIATQSMIEHTPNKTKQNWDKKAYKDRARLANFWDKRIINLLEAIEQGDNRLGAPEILANGEYKGWLSRRISVKHRLIYKVTNMEGQQTIHIKECGGHYEGIVA